MKRSLPQRQHDSLSPSSAYEEVELRVESMDVAPSDRRMECPLWRSGVVPLSDRDDDETPTMWHSKSGSGIARLIVRRPSWGLSRHCC